jgi:hypothetical protein
LYKLAVYVEDEKGVKSDINVKNILVDSIFCSNIGLLIDYSDDGVYDFFQSNSTGNKTSTILKENSYLIDIDGDKNWDYLFDVNTGSLISYSANYDELFGLVSIPFLYIVLLAIIILAILLIIYFYNINRRKLQKKSVYYTKEKIDKKVTKEKIISEEKPDLKGIKLDEIEKKIDELICKK